MLSSMAAGGMGGTRGVRMAHRVRSGGSTYDACPARHCWVADAVDGFGVKRPGRWVMVEEWTAEALLTPL